MEAGPGLMEHVRIILHFGGGGAATRGSPPQINRTKHQRSEHQRATDQLLYRSTKTR